MHLENPSGRLARQYLRLRDFDFEVVNNPGLKQLTRDVFYWLDTSGQNKTDICDKIFVLALSKTDTKTIDTFNEEDPASQQSTHYPDLKQADETISRATFIFNQSRDQDCQNYATFVPKVDYNIKYDTEGYLVRIAHLDDALQKFVATNLRRRVLYLAHNSCFQGRPGSTRMLNSLRLE